MRVLLVLAAFVAGCGARAGTGTAAGDPGGDGSDTLLWYSTCGDVQCSGHRDQGIAKCTTETIGQRCGSEGTQCDPENGCNQLLLCSRKDPREGGSACPISRASYKKDIHFLTGDELEAYRDELLALPLATYRYRQAPPDSRLHLGFRIDGHESLACVEPERDQVDLYGYASMAVAALKVQAREIDELKKEVADLRMRLDSRNPVMNPFLPPTRK